MLEIYVDDISLDIPESLSIDFQEDWSIFDFVQFAADFSWSFTAPDTPKNRKALRFAQLPESSSAQQRSFDCRIVLASRNWKRGLLYFDEAVPGGFELSFSGSLSKLAMAMESQSIRDLNWPFVSFSSSAKDHMNSICLDGNEQHDYTFFMIELLSESGNETLNKLVLNGSNPEFDVATGLPSPQLFVYKTLVRMAEDFNFSLKSNFFKDQELRKLVLLCNKRLAPPYRTNNFFSPYNIGPSLPEIGLKDFLKDLAKYFCLSMDYDSLTDELIIESRISLLESHEEVDWSDTLLSIQPMNSDAKEFKVVYSVNDADVDLSSDAFERLQQPKANAGAEEVKCGFGTIYSETNSNDLVSARVTGSIDTQITPYLLFFRGMSNDTYPSYGAWPIATSGDFGNSQYQTYWNGPKGVFDLWWKDFNEKVKNMRPARVFLRLTVDQVMLFNRRKIHRLGRYRVMFHQLKYSYSNGVIENAEGLVYVF